MILPVYVYGSASLKKVAEDINPDYPNLKELISNMFDTMYKADGVGLAAPQVGITIRLFIVDAEPMSEDDESVKGFKKIFINPHILEESGEEWYYNEGCLSLPGIREDVKRKPVIKIKYLDENFVEHIETFDGIKARIIQHEYDHLEARLFVDKLSQLRKRLLKRKLTEISFGKVDVNYKISAPNK